MARRTRGPGPRPGASNRVAANTAGGANRSPSVNGRNRSGNTRSRALVGLGILLAAVITALAGRRLIPHARSAGGGPVILISIDTLRADHLPAYGYRGVSTPAIDALAKDGVVFDRAYAHVPQTLPSHVSILSGQLPFEHGVRDNVGFTVKLGQRMLQTLLHARGYHTGGFASAFILRRETGIGQGFDVYDAQTASPTEDASFSSLRRDGAKTIDAAEQWLDKQASSRFFLFVHLYEPHRPYHPPERYSHYPNPYDGAIAYADELVGRLIGDLKSRGLYDDAVIVCTADHGEGLGDHGEREHGVFLYDSTIRVPLIVKLAGGRDAGRRVGEPAEHIDIVPTLLDLAGAPVPDDLRGTSLRAAMDGTPGGLADRGIYSETLYSLYHFGWSPLYALTDPRYRFIKAPRPELYDLTHDPAELRNLQPQRTATASSMRRALDMLVAGRGIDRPAATSGEDNARFQALGYIGSARMPAAAENGNLPDPKDKLDALEGYRQAVDLRSDGRLPEAVAAFRRVLADNPSMVDVWAQLAAVLTRQGLDRNAADALKHAVALDPDVAENQLALASAQITIGQLDEAAVHAKRAVERKPGAAHELLARIALAKANEIEAVKEAALATQTEPDLAFPLYVQGMAERKAGRYAQALPFFQRAVASLKAGNAEMSGLHMALADTLAHLNRTDEAEAEFKLELARFPQNQSARVGLALLYQSEGRAREAGDVLLEMVRTSPEPASYVTAARTFQVFGEADEARDVVARGLRQFPGSRELQAMK